MTSFPNKIQIEYGTPININSPPLPRPERRLPLPIPLPFAGYGRRHRIPEDLAPPHLPANLVSLPGQPDKSKEDGY